MKAKTFAVVLGIFILAIGGSILVDNLTPSTNETVKGENTDTTQSSVDIVFDGDHYKSNHRPLTEENHLFIALPDLVDIIGLETNESADELTITYEYSQLIYADGTIQNENAKEDEISTYLIKDDVIYIPDRHIERYLGVKVSPFYHEKTGTVALTSPEEQQKETIDQQIGTTIFVEKNDIPLAKYEPRDSLYLGGYVIQDEFIDASMNVFNTITEKQHATYFRYVGYGMPFPTEWVEQVKEVGGFPHIAWEPNDGLEAVVDDEYMRDFARQANEANVPILLRYASEMNGTWTAYSGDPELFIEKWHLVHDIMEEEAPNVMMLWNVFTMPEQTINDFYPGDDYVDYVGVNIYNVVYHNDRLDNISDFEDPLRLLDYVYNAYSHKKPIVIGEFGATNYTVTDGLYHVEFAQEKIRRMYKHLPELYPRVKAIYYFDVNNLVNAPEGRKINNYAITEHPRITEAYKEFTTTNDNYLSRFIDNQGVGAETFSYRDFLFYYEQELFVDVAFFSNYLAIDVEEQQDGYDLSYNGQNMTVESEKNTIDKSAFFEKRDVIGLPLKEVLDQFEIAYEVIEGDIHIDLR